MLSCNQLLAKYYFPVDIPPSWLLPWIDNSAGCGERALYFCGTTYLHFCNLWFIKLRFEKIIAFCDFLREQTTAAQTLNRVRNLFCDASPSTSVITNWCTTNTYKFEWANIILDLSIFANRCMWKTKRRDQGKWMLTFGLTQYFELPTLIIKHRCGHFGYNGPIRFRNESHIYTIAVGYMQTLENVQRG